MHIKELKKSEKAYLLLLMQVHRVVLPHLMAGGKHVLLEEVAFLV